MNATKEAPRERRQEKPTASRPTIDDFIAGLPYSTGYAARFFDRTPQWIRDQIRAGRLKAKRIEGTNDFMIDGESVRVLYGTLGFGDTTEAPATLPTADEDEAEALKILERLERAVQQRRVA